MQPSRQFSENVYALVECIPKGRVMTYGQIAGLCGNARAARIVGGIAHYGPVSLPWHRVVNRSGGLANGYYGGQEGQKAALVNEGVEVFGDSGDYKVLLETYLWSPNS